MKIVPASTHIAKAFMEGVHIVRSNCLTVVEESVSPCHFADVKYRRKDGPRLQTTCTSGAAKAAKNSCGRMKVGVWIWVVLVGFLSK